MVHSAVVPDDKVILLPAYPRLQLMILCDESLHKFLQHTILNIPQALKLFEVMPKREKRLPTSNGVGADAGVRSPQFWPLVLWCAAGAFPHVVDDVLGLVTPGHKSSV